MMELLNNKNNITVLDEHSIDLPLQISNSNKWPGCESKREHETITTSPFTEFCSRRSERLKLCNLILISSVMLFCIINGSAATSLGCSSNPCIFGVCIDDLNGSYSCYCIDGYTGRQCQTNWDECWSAPCLNGGTCIDGVASYNCTCLEGFNGINCEENLDECLSNPCQNGGTCDDRNNAYVCSCPSGYAGTNCELDVAVCDTGSGNKCHNGGLCVEGRGLDFTCECADGWTGRFCSINIDECESSPCLNGGVCIDKIAGYACSCSKEYTGPNCEESIKVCNDSPCKNSALCLMEEGQPICYCVPDFHGEKCEYQYDECQIGPRCQNGGQCVDGVDDFACRCRNDFKGMFCECLQRNENGELDCNYTMIDKMRTTTPRGVEFSTETISLTTGWSTSTLKFEETTTETSTGFSSFSPSSTITQIVPMTTTSLSDLSTTTMEILDLSRAPTSTAAEEISTTSETYETTERSESSSHSTTESIMEISTEQLSSTTIDILSSSSSIFTTKTPITRTTTKLRPCPPDMTRPPTTTKPSTTVRFSDTTTMRNSEFDSTTSSSGITSTIDYISTSTGKIDEDTSSFSTLETSTESSWGSPSSTTTTTLSTEISASSHVISTSSTTSSEGSELSTSLEDTTTQPTTTVRMTSVGDGMEGTSLETTTEVISSHETYSPSTEIDGATTEKSNEVTTTNEATVTVENISTSVNPDEISTYSTSTLSSSLPPLSTSFKPTDEIFTLTPHDVTTITSSASSCKDMECYNGGSCENTSEGPKCVCRFDRQDPQCRTLVRIKNAAFSGDSYLSHKIYTENQHETSVAKNLNQILSMKIEMKARTRATDGLILLASAQGSKGGHYTALFLHKGLLQFQFSCGLQTMLLSELEAPINTGHEFSIQVALDFSANHSHCNASLRINDTLAMSGDQPTWLAEEPLGKSKTIENVWLHLGGSPQTPVVLMSELPGGQGFTGCLHTLKINDEAKEIFRDASDGFAITECGSLACLANPCRNGGTCEEKLIEQHDMENDINQGSYESIDAYENRWTCRCPTGYLGATCEKSVCENNPCHFGGTCVEFPGSGYLCLCPLGKHGHYCEHNLDVDQPSFSGSINGLSSYISYPIPIPLESTLDLSFRITPSTAAQISLLAFLGQSSSHDDKSDHLALSYIQGYIMLTWNLGSGPRRIFTQRPLEFKDDEDEVISYHIQVVRQGRKASLYIDGKLNVTGNSPGDVARLDVIPTLYVGGHSLTNFSTLPHDLPLHSGFQGCIYGLQLKSGSLVVPLHETKGIFGRGVGQCGTRECHKHSCHNNGACLQHGSTYTCICPDGWFGTLCNQKMNPCDSGNHKCSSESTCIPLINGYECDCPLGMSGKYCETQIKYLSDVALTGKRSYFALHWPNQTQINSPARERYRQRMRMSEVDVFNYDTSIKLMAKNMMEHQRRAQLFSMEFQLRPLSESGLLMFLGDLGDRNDGFISLSITGGVLEFRISGRQGQLSIVKSNRVLAIGEWHKIRMSQNGRRLSLWVEGVSATNLLQQNSVFYHNYNSFIFVGGLPDLSMLPSYAVSGYPLPFKGCVRQFHMNGYRYVLNEQTIAHSRNINDCDGTACGGDSCDLGGNCYLDDKSNPHCKCPDTSKGVHCEIPESCTVIQCKNNGKCLANGACTCPNGWAGFFCEIATNKFSLPSFNGKSYMIVPSQRLTHKDKRNQISSQYSNRPKFIQVAMNISTINTNGLLAWSEGTSGDYLGFGLENGFFKLVSNLMNFTNQEIDIPTGGYLSDGGWHNIKLDVDEKGQIALLIDHKLIYNEVHSSEKNSNLDHIGGSFYVGGFPLNTSISNRTLNHFHKPFSGCLQGILITSFNGLNVPVSPVKTTSTSESSNFNLNEPNYQDFTSFEGENIGECDLFDEFVNSNAIIV